MWRQSVWLQSGHSRYARIFTGQAGRHTRRRETKDIFHVAFQSGHQSTGNWQWKRERAMVSMQPTKSRLDQGETEWRRHHQTSWRMGRSKVNGGGGGAHHQMGQSKREASGRRRRRHTSVHVLKCYSPPIKINQLDFVGNARTLYFTFEVSWLSFSHVA